MEIQVQFVTVRQDEQIVGTSVQVAVIAISQTGVAAFCLILAFSSCIRLHGSCRDISRRCECGIIFHSLFADCWRHYLGQYVYFGSIYDVRIVFLFYHDRAAQGSIFSLRLGLHPVRYGYKCQCPEYILYLFHIYN